MMLMRSPYIEAMVNKTGGGGGGGGGGGEREG